MDEKLAKGLTRSGFRSVDDHLDKAASTLVPVLLRTYGSRSGKQKTSKSDAQKLFAELRDFYHGDRNTVFCESHLDTRNGKLSPDFRAIMHCGILGYGEIDLEGTEQAISYFLISHRISRKRLVNRELALPLVLREHAVTRFIERSVGTFDSIGRALWPGLLLIEALARFNENLVVLPFILPTERGMFLGLSTLRRPDPAKIVETVISGESIEKIDSFRDLRSIRNWYVSTFVSLDEMRDDQAAIRERAIELIERHKNDLLMLHFLHVTYRENMGFRFDAASAERFSGPDFGAVEKDFSSFFSSNLWRNTVRMPNDSVFREEIEFQKQVDRYGLDVLLRSAGLEMEEMKQKLRETYPGIWDGLEDDTKGTANGAK